MDNQPLVVGIAGAKGSGKSTILTIATGILDTLNSKRVSTRETSDCIVEHLNDGIQYGIGHAILQSKHKPLARWILEQTGVYLRKENPDFLHDWILKQVKDAEEWHNPDYILIGGVRRLAECHAIKKVGGVIVRVYRETKELLPSEDELAYIHGDYSIDNNSNLQALENNVDELVKWLVKVKQEKDTYEKKE